MTRARITKLDEFQFLTCVKHGLWASRSKRFNEWLLRDKLIILVGNTLAGVGEVSGPQFESTEPVWDNGEFPIRIPIRFTHVALPEHRMPMLGDARETLSRAFDTEWGLGIVNQWLMKPDAAKHLIDLLEATPNDLGVIIGGIDGLLVEAKAKRIRAKPGRRPARSAVTRRPDVVVAAAKEGSARSQDVPQETNGKDTDHHKSQAALIDLGHIVGCSVWVASNDKGKTVDGKPLGRDCLPTLPNMGLSPEATRAIGLIDVIWIQKNAPVAAFEVETTTAIYSGLLRLSDLVEVVPALRLDLYIVAPAERGPKVIRELQRPTFRKIGLGDACKFIAIEDLLRLVKQTAEFKGHVQPTVIASIARGTSESEASGLS